MLGIESLEHTLSQPPDNDSYSMLNMTSKERKRLREKIRSISVRRHQSQRDDKVINPRKNSKKFPFRHNGMVMNGLMKV